MKKEYSPYIKLVADRNRPLFILDSGLNCIFSSDEDSLSVGDCLRDKLYEKLSLPLTESHELTAFLGNELCGIELIPAIREDGEACVLCRVVSGELAIKMATKSELCTDMISLSSKHEILAENVMQRLEKIQSSVNPASKKLETAQRDSLFLLASLKNTSEKLAILRHMGKRTLFDLSILCEKLAERYCNALANVGRAVDFIGSEGAYVYLDSRHAIAALVNALQNALIYSPADCIPSITVCRQNEFVEVRIQNKILTKNTDDTVTGSGLSVIRSFCEYAEGDCDMKFYNDKAVLMMRLPAAKQNKLKEHKLERDFFSAQYITRIPDFTEIKLRETELLLQMSD